MKFVTAAVVVTTVTAQVSTSAPASVFGRVESPKPAAAPVATMAQPLFNGGFSAPAYGFGTSYGYGGLGGLGYAGPYAGPYAGSTLGYGGLGYAGSNFGYGGLGYNGMGLGAYNTLGSNYYGGKRPLKNTISFALPALTSFTLFFLCLN
jgi:hypothetical protein